LRVNHDSGADAGQGTVLCPNGYNRFANASLREAMEAMEPSLCIIAIIKQQGMIPLLFYEKPLSCLNVNLWL